MSDTFQIIPYKVRSAGTDVPPEEVQAAINSLAQQTTVALNSVASDPTGPAGGDLSGTYPNPTVSAVHATSGTMSGVTINSSPIGQTTPAGGAFTTLTATTPVAATSGGTGRNALTANAVLIGEGSSQVNFAAPGAAGTLLASNGVAADPTFQTTTALNLALTTNPLSQFASTTSAQLAGVISDETGSGSLVFGTNPTISGATTTGGTINNTPVGATTPSTGSFTTLAASGAVSGAGFTARFASPGPIGNTAASTGQFTTLAASSTITPNSVAGIVGTTTNDNAQAGSVGEFISSNIPAGSAVALSTGVPANVTSISLTAGDWNVWGSIATNPAGTTTQTFTVGSISLTSATQAPAPNGGGTVSLPFTVGAAGVGVAAPVGQMRISIASTTTVFLVITSNFAASTNAGYGFIGARRVR